MTEPWPLRAPALAIGHVAALLLAACSSSSGDDLFMRSSATTDSTPPMFAGLMGVVADTPYSLRLVWTAATDDQSPATDIEYRVFVSQTSGTYDFMRPASRLVGAPAGVVGH